MSTQSKKKATIEKDLLVTQEEKEKEGPPMMKTENHIEGKEAPPMMKEDIEEKGVTQETQEKKETIMEAAGLGGEETARRVSVSRGILLQAPLLP